jgi:hypothetical protein
MIGIRQSGARQARIEEEREAGTLANRFPEVEKIVVTMTHWQHGIKSIVRNRWFFPSSFAFFKMSCLSRDCIDGGFDMSRIITEMVRGRSRDRKGELDCEANGPKACPAHVAYEIAIAYL